MADNKIHMPGVFGGLMRYDAEYRSKILFSPGTIVGFIIGIIALVFILKIFFPLGA